MNNQPTQQRLGASGEVWTKTGEKRNRDGVTVEVYATSARGYPSDFLASEWLAMRPNAPDQRPGQ